MTVGSGRDQRQLPRVAVVDVRRPDAREQRVGIERLEVGRDVLGLLHADLEGQEGVRVLLVEPDRQQVARRP